MHCANRGTCDFTSGTCNCYSGYGGPACTDILYLNSDQIRVNVQQYDFTSSVMDIEVLGGSPSSNFFMVEAIANDNNVFAVRADGALTAGNKLQVRLNI